MLPQQSIVDIRSLPLNSYVDLDPLIDIASLRRLHAEICFGLLNAEINYSHAGDPASEVKANAKGFWDKNWQAKLLAKHPKLGEHFINLHPAKQRMFACYFNEFYSLMTIPIINQTNHKGRNSIEQCTPHPINYPLFTSVINWVNDQDIFETYGRVILFITPPGFKTVLHRDGDDYQAFNEEFMWISPARNKKMILANHITGEEKVIPAYTIWFNSNQYHGTEETIYHGYSLRIDGKFNDRTRKFLNNKFVSL